MRAYVDVARLLLVDRDDVYTDAQDKGGPTALSPAAAGNGYEATCRLS